MYRLVEMTNTSMEHNICDLFEKKKTYRTNIEKNISDESICFILKLMSY